MFSFGLRLGSGGRNATFQKIVEYLLTEPLVLDTGYYYTPNTGIDPNTDGKLINLADGLAWTPTALQYPEDGTIDLSGGKAIDTQIIFPSDAEWTYPQVYNVDGLGNYDVIAMRYKGNGTADVRRGNQSTSLTLLPNDTNLLYTPPLTTYKVIEFPEIPAKAVFTFSGIANISDTLAHEITITCNTHIDPATFSTADIIGDNGVVSNLVQSATNPLVWTFDYTANTGVADTTNVITIGTAIADLWGNLPASASVSENFEVSTSAPTYGEVTHIAMTDYALGLTSSPPAGVTVNHITTNTDTTTVFNMLDADGVDNGITFNLGVAFTGKVAGLTPSGTDANCMYDVMLEERWYTFYDAIPKTVDIFLPEGTYKLRVGAHDSATDARRTADYVWNGQTITHNASLASPACIEFNDVVVGVGGAITTLTLTNGDIMTLSALEISKQV